MSRMLAVVVAVLLVVGLFWFVDVDQTQEARMPDMDFQVEDGRMPDYDVSTGSVSVDSKETEVTVPDIEVTTEKKKIEVPTISVEPAPAD